MHEYDAGRPRHTLTAEQAAVLRGADALDNEVSRYPLTDESGMLSAAEAVRDAYLAQHRATLDAIHALQQTGPLLSPDGELLRHSVPALRGECVAEAA